MLFFSFNLCPQIFIIWEKKNWNWWKHASCSYIKVFYLQCICSYSLVQPKQWLAVNNKSYNTVTTHFNHKIYLLISKLTNKQKNILKHPYNFISSLNTNWTHSWSPIFLICTTINILVTVNHFIQILFYILVCILVSILNITTTISFSFILSFPFVGLFSFTLLFYLLSFVHLS